MFYAKKDWSMLRRLVFGGGIGGSYTEYTVTGNPVSFSTNVAKPLKQLLVPFTPVQSGSGDPSPENVRPITGFTGVNVTANGTTIPIAFPALGKNLFDKTAITESKYVNSLGALSSSANFNASDYIPVIGGESYRTQNTGSAGSTYIAFYDDDKEPYGTPVKQDAVSINFTTPIGASYVRFSVAKTNMDTAMLVKGSSAVDYEPFTNTAYGGTLDVLSGGLTVTHGIVDLSTLDYSASTAANHVFRSDSLKNVIKPPLTNYEIPDIISDIYSAMAWGPISATDNGRFSVANVGSTSEGRLVLINQNYNTTSDFVSAMSGHAIVYPLAKPLEFQLTPQQVTALVGDNVLFTDTNGTNEITYLKKG